MTTKHTFWENVLRIVAVVGLIAVLLLGAWGIIQLAFIIPGFFSNIGSSTTTTTSKESMTLSAPMAVNSGSTFTALWTHKKSSATYGYSLSYACVEGLSLKAPVATGSYQAVACNTPFNYVNSASSMPLIASATQSSTLTLTVSATNLSTGAVTATATANTNVAVSQAVAPVKKPVTTYTKTSSGARYVASGRTTQLYGYADLAVYITSNLTTVRAGSRVSLQFVVTNVGTNVAPAGWTFNAVLPYNPVYTYPSGPQQALYPGDKIVYTLGYDAQYSGNGNQISATGGCDGWSYPCNPGTPVYGGPGTCNSYGPCAVPGYQANIYGYVQPGSNYGTYQTASIQVDPNNLVWESNESNNNAAVSYNVY